MSGQYFRLSHPLSGVTHLKNTEVAADDFDCRPVQRLATAGINGPFFALMQTCFTLDVGTSQNYHRSVLSMTLCNIALDLAPRL